MQPAEPGKNAGVRMGGPFWSTVVAETDCPCDSEESMIANRVQKPRMDILLSPATVQTFRQILRLDFPYDKIPDGLVNLTEYLQDKRFSGLLQKYFIENPTDGRWIFHGYRGGQEAEFSESKDINVANTRERDGGGLDPQTGLLKGLMLKGVDAQVRGIMEFSDSFF